MLQSLDSPSPGMGGTKSTFVDSIEGGKSNLPRSGHASHPSTSSMPSTGSVRAMHRVMGVARSEAARSGLQRLGEQWGCPTQRVPFGREGDAATASLHSMTGVLYDAQQQEQGNGKDDADSGDLAMADSINFAPMVEMPSSASSVGGAGARVIDLDGSDDLDAIGFQLQIGESDGSMPDSELIRDKAPGPVQSTKVA